MTCRPSHHSRCGIGVCIWLETKLVLVHLVESLIGLTSVKVLLQINCVSPTSRASCSWDSMATASRSLLLDLTFTLCHEALLVEVVATLAHLFEDVSADVLLGLWGNDKGGSWPSVDALLVHVADQWLICLVVNRL